MKTRWLSMIVAAMGVVFFAAESAWACRFMNNCCSRVPRRCCVVCCDPAPCAPVHCAPTPCGPITDAAQVAPTPSPETKPTESAPSVAPPAPQPTPPAEKPAEPAAPPQEMPADKPAEPAAPAEKPAQPAPPADKPAEKPADAPAPPAKPIDDDPFAHGQLPGLRLWTDASGKHQVIARFVAVVDGQVRLQTADGQFVRIVFDRLSVADRRFVEQHATVAALGR